MTRRLRLTTYALADLDEIFEFLAARNPTAAHRYVSRLREQCDVYLANPFMGQREPEVAERLRESPERVRSFLYRNHRCYYLVTDDEMRVLGFIDTRQDIEAELEERFPN
jgi:plasmid stabilization system protein ParE